MVTSPFTSPTNPSGTASSNTAGSAGSSSSSASSGSSTASHAALALTPTDFINMMITQLKNQDPMQPTSNGELLQQMSQIGQLQSQQNLQTSLQSMVLQNQIGSASNFIGKSVQGLDVNNNNITGVVDSVHVETGGVNLVLDNGTSLGLSRVTDVLNGTSGSASTSGSAATAPTTSAGTSNQTTA